MSKGQRPPPWLSRGACDESDLCRGVVCRLLGNFGMVRVLQALQGAAIDEQTREHLDAALRAADLADLEMRDHPSWLSPDSGTA